MRTQRHRLALLTGLACLAASPLRADDGLMDLDDAARAESRDLDAFDSGSSVSLDAAESGSSALPEPAAVPDLQDADARAAAERARADLVAARERLARANTAYAIMRERDYPRGNARGALLAERDAARQAYAEADARYAELLDAD